MSTISVIVPVINVEQYLSRCIESILAQTFSDFELILVDDGSTDKSGIICDEYTKKDNRIHIIHQKNGGQSTARNAGLDWVFANSDSDWISFVDSDDWIHPFYLSYLFQALNETNGSISSCTFVRKDIKDDSFHNKEYKISNWKAEDFHCNCGGLATVTCGKLYKKELFEDIRFPIGRIFEDKAVTYKILFSVNDIVLVDADLYYYFRNDNGTTSGKWNNRQMDVFIALEEQIVVFDSNGFPKASEHAKKEYVYKLNNTLILLQKDYPSEFKKEKTILKTKIRKALKLYKDVWNFVDNKWIYGIVYPRQMKLYWLLSNIIKRISKQ